MGAARQSLSSEQSANKADILFFENRLLSYEKAAEMLGCSERTLRKLKTEGRIKSVCIGSGARGVRFRVSTLLKFIEKNEVSA